MEKEEKNIISENGDLHLVCDGESVGDNVTPEVAKKIGVLQSTPLKNYAFAKLTDWVCFSFISGLVTASWVVLFYFILKYMGVV